MPNYASSNQAALIYENSQQFLWNQEVVAAGTLSIGWELYRVSRSYYPWGLSVEVSFASAPGAFEVDIMAANSDQKGSYIKVGSITAVNASNVGRFDMPSNIWPKYVAALVLTLGNAVAITAQVTR